MKKLLGMFMASVLVLGSLASCGKTTDTAGGPVELRISWWGGDSRHQATLNAIKMFEEKNPNITVKSEYTGFQGHQEKLTTQIAGRTEPDVMQLNWPWVTALSPSGTGFYDLNELKDTIQLDNFSDEMLNYGKVNGVLNAIPVGTTGRVVWANKTTYDKFGAKLPETWDDLFAAADKFDDGYYPLDLDNGSAQSGFLMMLSYLQQQTGKGFLTEDNKLNYTVEELTRGYEFYQSLVDKKVVASIEERSGLGGKTELFEMPNWINGNYAGVYEWTSSVGKYAGPLKETNQELVMVGLPQMPDAKASGVIAKPSLLWGISKNTKHPKEAAMLLDFLLNDPEAAAELGLERGVPASKAALEVLDAAGELKGLEYEGTNFIVENTDIPLSPYFEDAELKKIYQSVMEQFGYGKITAAQAAEQLSKDVTARLASI